MAPFIVSPHDSSIVYAGYQFLFRSDNRGDAWTRISPDLASSAVPPPSESVVCTWTTPLTRV